MIHLEPAEVLAVLRAAKAHNARAWAMLLLAYRHGLRASEVCNLKTTDIDLKNGSIVVERLKGSLRTVQAISGHRGEPLLDELKALRAWLQQRRHDGSDFLFTSQKGGRLDRSQFFRVFRSVAAAAGLSQDKQHPHVLKHSLATHLVAANVNLALVKTQLGHKSINSTLRYVSTTDRQASQATTTALMGNVLSVLTDGWSAGMRHVAGIVQWRSPMLTHYGDEDPELQDEDDPAFQEELFRISRFLGCKPEDMMDKEFAAKYAEWLKTEPPEE